MRRTCARAIPGPAALLVMIALMGCEAATPVPVGGSGEDAGVGVTTPEAEGSGAEPSPEPSGSGTEETPDVITEGQEPEGTTTLEDPGAAAAAAVPGAFKGASESYSMKATLAPILGAPGGHTKDGARQLRPGIVGATTPGQGTTEPAGGAPSGEGSE